MRRISPSSLLILVVSFFAYGGSPVPAQNCDAIIQHGLRNVAIKSGAEGRVATTHFNHCHKDLSSLDDSTLGSVEIEVFGIGSGGGSYSRARRESRLTDWCKESQKFASANRRNYEESRQFYDAAVAAWSRCNELRSKDVLVDFVSSEGSVVQINLRYAGATRSGVRLIGVDATGFSCKTRVPAEDGYRLLVDNELEGAETLDSPEIGKEAIAIKCYRDAATRREIDGEQFEYQPQAVIAIDTASLPFQFSFVEVWRPDLPRHNAAQLGSRLGVLEKDPSVPVGTIIAWDPYIRDETGEPVEERPLPSGWQICDGDNGTPDLSEKFLMGAGERNIAGTVGGNNHLAIPEKEVVVKASGWLGELAASPHGGPEEHQGWGSRRWHKLESKGRVSWAGLENRPAFFSVIYIMKVTDAA